jgi:hypothetical protein
MASAYYLKLLRDPRWQKLRLEVFERDGWACVSCESTDRTLQVHHKRYLSGKKPWEYDSDDLATLCEDCHTRETDDAAHLKEAMRHLSPGGGDIAFLAGVAIGLRFRNAMFSVDGGTRQLTPWAHDRVMVGDYKMAMGIGVTIGVDPEVIIKLLTKPGYLSLPDLLAICPAELPEGFQ